MYIYAYETVKPDYFIRDSSQAAVKFVLHTYARALVSSRIN